MPRLAPSVTPTLTVVLLAPAFAMLPVPSESGPTVIIPVLSIQSSPEPPLIPAAFTSAIAAAFDDASPAFNPTARPTVTVVAPAWALAIGPRVSKPPTVIAPVLVISSSSLPPSIPVALALAVAEESAVPVVLADPSPIVTATEVAVASASALAVDSISLLFSMVSIP